METEPETLFVSSEPLALLKLPLLPLLPPAAAAAVNILGDTNGGRWRAMGAAMQSREEKVLSIGTVGGARDPGLLRSAGFLLRNESIDVLASLTETAAAEIVVEDVGGGGGGGGRGREGGGGVGCCNKKTTPQKRNNKIFTGFG